MPTKALEKFDEKYTLSKGQKRKLQAAIEQNKKARMNNFLGTYNAKEKSADLGQSNIKQFSRRPQTATSSELTRKKKRNNNKKHLS